MANRTFSPDLGTLAKSWRKLFCTISVTEAVTPVPSLLKWNYPTFGGGGPNAFTYTAAAVPSTLPTGAGPYPKQYEAGTEGVLTVVRTAIGKYTLTLQDNYQRLVNVNAYAAVASGTPVFAICTENTTITNLRTTSGLGVIGLAFWDFNGAAVDPIGNVRIALELLDASEP